MENIAAKQIKNVQMEELQVRRPLEHVMERDSVEKAHVVR